MYTEYSHGHSNVASFSGSSKFGILNGEGGINKENETERGGTEKNLGVEEILRGAESARERKGIAFEISGVL